MSDEKFTTEEIRKGRMILVGIIAVLVVALGIFGTWYDHAHPQVHSSVCEQNWHDYGQYGQANMPVTHSAYIEKCEGSDDEFFDQTGQ